MNPCLKKYWQGISEYFIHAHQDTNKITIINPLSSPEAISSLREMHTKAVINSLVIYSIQNHPEFLSVNMQHTGV
uniref:Uncharacterized protein n=3 Tax=Klebsiella pneumoniae TaxID=573 RepID=A0A8F7PWN1_KLEPN|nr:hypothetical protein [Klebsiella pneumoniae subsp. pneumoniae]QXV91220.1 hypothetical protein [Klebsiella pneumoniae subsp. pneumoniae]